MSSSHLGMLGGSRCYWELLDWLAFEFEARNLSMKEMQYAMVTSETYKLASEGDRVVMSANLKADPQNSYLWHYRVQRLEAEPVWDSILTAAGSLHLSIVGPAVLRPGGGGRGGRPVAVATPL